MPTADIPPSDETPPTPTPSSSSPEICQHPWLLVTCGTCGAPVDALRPGPAPAEGETPAAASGAEGTQALFIVARGDPELVAQIRAMVGQSGTVQVIEDRRRAARPTLSSEEEAASLRSQLRRRVLGEESRESE